MKDPKVRENLREFLLMTIGVEIIVIGNYFFKFPNNYSWGGVTGAAVLLSKFTDGFLTRGNIILIFNAILLVLGFFSLGRSFGAKTVYCTVLMSLSLQVLEWIVPMSHPVTDQPLVELSYAIFLPALGAAMLFNTGASSGGTDIIAMIVKKHSALNIGTALMYTDLILTLLVFPMYGVTTGLLSMMGLGMKSLVIDNVIENINLCKYCNIICDDAEPILRYIEDDLERSATVADAVGAYYGKNKKLVLTVLSRRQAVLLRNFVRKTEPSAFIIITNTSEIIGKGFHTSI